MRCRWKPRHGCRETSALIAPLLRRQKRALANLARAFPDMSLAERTDVAAAMWENLGRTFVESFRLKNSGRKRSHRLLARRAVRRRRTRSAVHRLRPSHGQLGDPGAWRQAHGSADRRSIPTYLQPTRRSENTQDARPLYLGGLLPKTAITARALLRAIKTAPVLRSSLTFVTIAGPRCCSSANPRVRMFFLPFSLGPPGCRSMPASPFAVRTCGSPFALSRYLFRTRATGTPTLSSQPKRCNASSKPSFAKRRSNGCGPTGSGTSPANPAAPGRAGGQRGDIARREEAWAPPGKVSAISTPPPRPPRYSLS